MNGASALLYVPTINLAFREDVNNEVEEGLSTDDG